MTVPFSLSEARQRDRSPRFNGCLHCFVRKGAVGKNVMFMRSVMGGMTEQIGHQSHHIGIVIDEAEP